MLARPLVASEADAVAAAIRFLVIFETSSLRFEVFGQVEPPLPNRRIACFLGEHSVPRR